MYNTLISSILKPTTSLNILEPSLGLGQISKIQELSDINSSILLYNLE